MIKEPNWDIGNYNKSEFEGVDDSLTAVQVGFCVLYQR